MSSEPTDLTNLGLKIFRKKNFRKFPKAKLEFVTYPATICIAFTLY